MRNTRQRHLWRTRVLALLVAAVALACLPFAATASADTVVDHDRKGKIEIIYVDGNGKGVDGAVFTARLVGEPLWNGAFRSLVDVPIDADTDPGDIVALAEGIEPVRAETNVYGLASMEDLEQGLYLVEEEVPAEGHYASVPFFATIPYIKDGEWDYDLEVRPKPLAAGSLVIRKEVRGTLGESQRKFRFKVTIDQEGEFPIRYSTGEEATMKSGDVIMLAHGDSATVDMIPIGASYLVEEVEAGLDGYATEAEGDNGMVDGKEPSEAVFVNTRGEVTPPVTPGASVTPPPCTCPPDGPTCTPSPQCTCPPDGPTCTPSPQCTCPPDGPTCTPVVPCTTCTPYPGEPTRTPPPDVQTGDTPYMAWAFMAGIALLSAGAAVLAVAMKRSRK